ncbi:MAG: hypothetical protein J7501_17060, partial [Bdellovibrio sp.]|nr:hypothetical protein [Bdellovibrio sp.]
MDFTDKKLEIAILTMAAVLVGSLGYVLKSPVQSAIQNAEISFEMVRPKSFLAALFDLGDREVSRKYVNPFDKKKDDKTAAVAPKGTEIPKPAAAAAKAIAKKADDKKKEDEKKPTVEMNVVSAAETNRIADSDIGSGGASAADG